MNALGAPKNEESECTLFDPEPIDSAIVKLKRPRGSWGRMNAQRSSPECTKITINKGSNDFSRDILKNAHPQHRLWVAYDQDTLAQTLHYIRNNSSSQNLMRPYGQKRRTAENNQKEKNDSWEQSKRKDWQERLNGRCNPDCEFSVGVLLECTQCRLGVCIQHCMEWVQKESHHGSNSFLVVSCNMI